VKPLKIIALSAALVLPSVGAAAQDGGWFGLGLGDRFRGWVAGQVEGAVPGLEIGALDRASLGGFDARDVTLSDERGVWLRIDRARVSLKPLDIARGTLRIEAMEAGTVTVERLPEGGEQAPAPEPESGGGLLPKLPDLPVDLVIDRMKVERLRLAEPVLGQEAALGLEGSARLGDPAQGLAATLRANRVDGREGTVALDLAYAPEGERLDVDLAAREPEGGLAATLLGLPGRPPVSLALDGEGALSDWRGRLELDAGAGLGARADLTVRAEGAARRLALAATGRADALLPEAARPLVGPDPRLEAEVVLPPEGPIRLDPARLRLAAGEAVLSGAVDAAQETVALDWRVEAGAGSALAALLPDARWRSIVLAGRAEGPLARPALDATAEVEAPGYAGFGAGSARVVVQARPQGQGDAVAFALDGAVRGVEGLDPALGPLVGEAVTLAGAGEADLATGALRLDRLEAALAAGRVTASGTAADWGRTARVRARAEVPELARLAGLAGTPLEGALGLDAEAALAADGGIEGRLGGGATGLATGIAPADALLGGRLDLAARLLRTAEGAIRVEDLSAEGERVRLTGRAGLAAGRVDAAWTLAAPDLGPLGAALGTDLAGAVSAEGTAAGPLDAIEARLRAEGRGLVAAGTPVGAPVLTATARGLPSAPEGRVDLRARHAERPVALDGAYALRGDRLSLPELSLGFGEARLAGAAELDLAGPRATGRLDGRVPDLAAFSDLLGQPLAGSGTLALVLSAPEGRQAAELTAALDGPRLGPAGTPTAAARSLRATARLADLLGAPRGRVELAGEGVAAGGFEASALTAQAEGGPDEARFEARAAGATPIELAGAFARTAEGPRIRLDRASAGVGDQSFALARPATLTLGEALRLEGFVLDARGGGRVAADATLGPSRLDGRVRIDRVPLALARLVDPALPLSGTLDGEATLSGTRRDPRAAVDLRVAGAGLASLGRAGVAPLDATLSARLGGGRLGAEAAARSADGAVDLRATAGLPVALGPDLVPAIPDRAALTGALAGALSLEPLNDLLAASGDRVGGRVAVDLRFGGTVEAPLVSGSADLLEARYANQALGTVIEDIRGRLEGSGRSLRIVDLRARTPGGGQIFAGGSVDLNPGAPRPIDVRVTLDDARVVQNELGVVVTDGDLSARGDFSRVELGGTVRVQRAEIYVPDRLPPSVVALDVEVVDSGRPLAPRGAPPPPRRKPDPARAGNGGAGAGGAEPPIVIALDVTVVAENQVFVRGRGLDAELGGRLAIEGTADKPVVAGALNLIKGELSLIGQRFEFDSGKITLLGEGSLEPILDLVATADAGDVKAKVTVSGRVSAPEVKFSSEPELPQDEVLARVLFGKGVDQLSAFEAVQLAQSAAQLAGIGGGGPGVLDRVRRALGVDRLDITSGSGDAGSQPGVAAGRYLNENVYVGVEQDVGGGSRATVELDVTDNIQLEADVGGRKGSSVGVQFEWEY
jgi:translocation and assembly module TamB